MQFNAVVETNVAAVRLWQALGFEIMTTIPRHSSTPDTEESVFTSCTSGWAKSSTTL
jgi:hypothetical protein